YPVIFNYVPADLKVESPEFIKDISDQNNIPIEEIHSVCWLIDSSTTKKKHGSIVINMLLKELAKLMEKGGVYVDCNRLKGKKYTQAPTMCIQCLNIGHIQTYFNEPFICASCGRNHNTQEC
ncbi:hypothetical protein CROQUDRAFT_18893, partial [Cronartium quercuum f. sp. fusiforme G11]